MLFLKKDVSYSQNGILSLLVEIFQVSNRSVSVLLSLAIKHQYG
jgi:hypothetical protein